MNIVFVGGGSLRLVPILRAVFQTPEIMADGSIRLVDLRVDRAEAVGKMIMACPEYANVKCPVTWTADMDAALDGADLVYVTMAALRQPSAAQATRLSAEYGFLCSDQLSINGAFLSARIGNTVVGFARKMEKHCPNARMLIFCNPVAVYSGAVNNHTKIKALGICGGFNNHRWDLARMCGHDCCDMDWNIVSAGVNHCALILRGTYRGRDFREVLGEALTPDWKLMKITTLTYVEACTKTLTRMVQGYRQTGHMLFSSEGDGFEHLYYADAAAKLRENAAKCASEPEPDYAKIAQESREKIEQAFAEFGEYAAGRKPQDWSNPVIGNNWFKIAATDITVPILKALKLREPMRIAASRPNGGAVAGMPDDAVLEYTMTLCGNDITPEPNLYIPSPYKGLIAGLSEFQTLLGDAIALRDPKIFAEALAAYPVNRGVPGRNEYFRKMFEIYTDIDPELRAGVNYLID